MSTQVSKVYRHVALAMLLSMNQEVSGCQQACLHFHKYLKTSHHFPCLQMTKEHFLSEITLLFSEICPKVSGGLITAVPLKELLESVKPIFSVPNEEKWKAA